MTADLEYQAAALAPKPGFAPERIVRLMHEAIARLELDLRGLTVLTEAATGAYGVTAPLAALAGAKRVYAIARSSRHGAASQAIDWTMYLAELAHVAERITASEQCPEQLGRIDIVTNSGHLRPIERKTIAQLKSDAVIALMFESWEMRDGDIDLAACRERGIRIAGVNERHPAVDVFSYLGPLCARQLHDAGIPVYGNKIALLCDNHFSSFLERSLRQLGGKVCLFRNTAELMSDQWDCIVIALHPGAEPRVGLAEAAMLAEKAKGAIIAQFWGDIDRPSLRDRGFGLYPEHEPKRGHMAVLLSEIGPDPIVRLQAGGLKAAEIIFKTGAAPAGGIAQLC